ncbi:AAA family ATPase [Yoonia sp. 2307UL14-13]|uniref:AAA family ATPase n=1 Tax=Yoonia sp. 2307UL14-13 TaxID=3126506 RepID=UPI0030A01F4A
MKRPDFAQLLDLVPRAPDWQIDWHAIWGTGPEFTALDTCPQDPIHHAEGDAGTHTRMVVAALVAQPDWRTLPDTDRSMLFWAACLHDIGKPATTKYDENGRITSRGHSRLGASMARGLLRDAQVDFHWREAICGIIAKHQLPFWLIERPKPERLAIATSLICRPDLLCLHARADALGRICDDQQAVLDNVALAETCFAEAGCARGPFPFANAESRLAFLERDDRDPHYAAQEDFRCTVHVMSALPGTGKDTWIAANLPDLPVVSLDAIRTAAGISPTDNQGAVIQAAYEQARVHLRAGQDFIWNATNITAQMRGKVLRLLRDYNARIHLVYLEVPPDQLRRQNSDRAERVPHDVVLALSRKLEPPTTHEAHQITYDVPEIWPSLRGCDANATPATRMRIK